MFIILNMPVEWCVASVCRTCWGSRKILSVDSQMRSEKTMMKRWRNERRKRLRKTRTRPDHREKERTEKSRETQVKRFTHKRVVDEWSGRQSAWISLLQVWVLFSDGCHDHLPCSPPLDLSIFGASPVQCWWSQGPTGHAAVGARQLASLLDPC